MAAGRTAIHKSRPRGRASRLAHRPPRGHGQPLCEATPIAQADPRRLRLIERQPAGRRPRLLGRRAPSSAAAMSVAAVTVRIRGAAREPRNQRRDQQRRREHDQHVDQREWVRVADVRPVRHVPSVPPERRRQTGPPTALAHPRSASSSHKAMPADGAGAHQTATTFRPRAERLAQLRQTATARPQCSSSRRPSRRRTSRCSPRAPDVIAEPDWFTSHRFAPKLLLPSWDRRRTEAAAPATCPGCRHRRSGARAARDRPLRSGAVDGRDRALPFGGSGRRTASPDAPCQPRRASQNPWRCAWFTVRPDADLRPRARKYRPGITRTSGFSKCVRAAVSSSSSSC